MISPLKNINDIVNWVNDDLMNVSHVNLKESVRKRKKGGQKMIICHDMMGGY